MRRAVPPPAPLPPRHRLRTAAAAATALVRRLGAPLGGGGLQGGRAKALPLQAADDQRTAPLAEAEEVLGVGRPTEERSSLDQLHAQRGLRLGDRVGLFHRGAGGSCVLLLYVGANLTEAPPAAGLHLLRFLLHVAGHHQRHPDVHADPGCDLALRGGNGRRSLRAPAGRTAAPPSRAHRPAVRCAASRLVLRRPGVPYRRAP